MAVLAGAATAAGSTAGASTVTETAIPTASSNPFGIVAGPDGALWFTEFDGNKIGRITTVGAVTETTIPTANSLPRGIVAGSDGALWFTERDGNKIGRITTAGAVTETTIPTANSSPLGIVAGPDGALWFTERAANMIGRITTAGVVSETAVPTANSGPERIAAGSDGALWFTEFAGNKIGRITTPGTPGPPVPPAPVPPAPVPAVQPGLPGTASGPVLPPRPAAVVVKVANSVLPDLTCVDRRAFRFPVRQARASNGNVLSATVYVGRRKVKTVTGTNIGTVAITKLPRGRFTVKVVTVTSKNLQITSTRTYRACGKGQRSELKRKHKRR